MTTRRFDIAARARTCLTVIAVFLLLPFAAGAQALGVRHVALSVPARDSNWTSTELTVDEGDLIAVRAAGTVVIGVFSREVDADDWLRAPAQEWAKHISSSASETAAPFRSVAAAATRR